MTAAAVSACRAEWTKARTLPGSGWLLLITVVATVGVSALAIATVDCPAGTCEVAATLTGVRVGQAVVVIVSVLMVADEYRTGLISTTFTAVPRRVTVLVAKAAVVAAGLAVTATAAVLGALAAGRLLLPGRQHPVPDLTDGEVLRAFGGSVLYLVLVALLGVGAATVARSTAAAMGTMLGLLYVFPILASAAPDERWQRRLQQIGPMDAGLAVQKVGDLSGLPLQPWHGLGVLALWAAASLLVAAVLLSVRDAQ